MIFVSAILIVLTSRPEDMPNGDLRSASVAAAPELAAEGEDWNFSLREVANRQDEPLPSSSVETRSRPTRNRRSAHRLHAWYALLEKYLRHHSLVFVLQKMAVKQRHSPDNRIGKVHDQVD